MSDTLEARIADICRLIHADPDISDSYKAAITYGKASDWSIRKVSEVLRLKAAWEALKVEQAAGASESYLRLIEAVDFEVYAELDRKFDYAIEDERL